MKIKDFMNGIPIGRIGNLIYYTRDGEPYMRRYEIPGKKKKWEIEGRTPKQREVTARFTAVHRKILSSSPHRTFPHIPYLHLRIVHESHDGYVPL